MKKEDNFLFSKYEKQIVSGMYIFLFMIFLFTYIFSRVMSLDIIYFLRDPIATLKAPFYIGFLSNIGIILWALTVGVCFFTCFVVENGKEAEGVKFIFFSGIFSLILLLDDFFLIHEVVLPRHFHISQEFLLIGYLLYLILLIAKFNGFIMKTEYIYFILSLFLFFNSLVFDFLREFIELEGRLNSFGMVVEDGLKIFGVLTWLIFYSKACKKLIVSKNYYYRNVK